MQISQVAIQLYTLRDHCRTVADYAASLKKVARIGYQAIEIAGVGPIPEAELRAIADGEGLTICAAHDGSDVIRQEPRRVVDRLGKLGCKYAAYPYPNGVDFTDEAHLRSLAADLDAAGKLLQANGQVLTYHNHADEFIHFQGRPALDFLYGNTGAAVLQAELDTYWVQAGGANPEAWCQKLHGRLPLLHLKDYATLPGKPHTTAEIGRGNLDFPAIIAAAETSGCKWFIVEQDHCPGDPFESIAISFEHIRDHLVS